MKVRFDPQVIKKVKKLDVRIKKSFRERLELFRQNPLNPQLHNHPLKRKYEGYRSIDITADYRALYQERIEGEETIAYFVLLGTHPQLYR